MCDRGMKSAWAWIFGIVKFLGEIVKFLPLREHDTSCQVWPHDDIARCCVNVLVCYHGNVLAC